MIYKLGANTAITFTLSHPTTKAPANADSLPACSVLRNGVKDVAVVVTVVNEATARYKASWTTPVGYTRGDTLEIHAEVTVAGVAGGGVVARGVCDTVYPSETATVSEARAALLDNLSRLDVSSSSILSAERAALIDNLTRLDAPITSIPGAGTVAPHLVQFEVRDEDGNPVGCVEVYVFSEFGGHQPIKTGRTGEDGKTPVGAITLEEGTFYVRLYPTGYNVQNDNEIVVDSEHTEFPFTVQRIAYPLPTQPGYQTLFGYAKELGPQWAVGDIVAVVPRQFVTTDGITVSWKEKTATVGADGVWSLEVDKGLPVRWSIHRPKHARDPYVTADFTTSLADTANIKTYFNI